MPQFFLWSFCASYSCLSVRLIVVIGRVVKHLALYSFCGLSVGLIVVIGRVL
jgi:hypothetical protein